MKQRKGSIKLFCVAGSIWGLIWLQGFFISLTYGLFQPTGYWWRSVLLVYLMLSSFTWASGYSRAKEPACEFQAGIFRPKAVLNAGGNRAVKQRARTNPCRSFLRSHRNKTPQCPSGSSLNDFADPSHDGPKDENKRCCTFTEP